MKALFNKLKTHSTNAKDYVEEGLATEEGKAFKQKTLQIIARAVRNKHVANTLGAGLVGVLISLITFLPMQLCFTIGVVMGAYKSLTSN
jgi:hypothetical protein